MQNEIAGYGYYEICGVIFALIYVLLAIKERRLCWIAAIVSSAAYIPTFYIAKLYTEAVLQVFFILLAIYGWLSWTKKSQTINLVIGTRNGYFHIQIVLYSVISSIILGYYLSNFTNASYPYADSLVTVFSITTSFMQARKILENWIYWIIIDSLAIAIYIQKGLYLTAGLFGLYLGLAAAGFFEWRKIMKNQQIK